MPELARLRSELESALSGFSECMRACEMTFLKRASPSVKRAYDAYPIIQRRHDDDYDVTTRKHDVITRRRHSVEKPRPYDVTLQNVDGESDGGDVAKARRLFREFWATLRRNTPLASDDVMGDAQKKENDVIRLRNNRRRATPINVIDDENE